MHKSMPKNMRDAASVRIGSAGGPAKTAFGDSPRSKSPKAIVQSKAPASMRDSGAVRMGSAGGPAKTSLGDMYR